MNKRTVILLLLIMILRLEPQCLQAQEFFLRTDAWHDAKKIHLDAIEIYPEKTTKKAQNITLRTKSGLELPALFFDRGSNIALIAGQALPGSKESMLVYSGLFDNYDVILFDYRWSNNYFSSLLKSIVLCSPTRRLLLDEEEEVYAALSFMKQHKKYEKIIGLGECYSDFLFAKIQADGIQKSGTGPFTHLIFDSCWYSLKSIAESICTDPLLPIEPQEGGAPWIIKKITNSSIVKWPLLKIIFTILNDVSIEEYLSKLNTPVLFIYGCNDLFVQKHQFESIWRSVPKEKRAVLLTPYRHSDNLHNKSVYRFVCEQFVNAASIVEFQENCKMII